MFMATLGLVLYSLLLMLLVPVTIRARANIVNGRPLTRLQNNRIVSSYRTQDILGGLYVPAFWIGHITLLLFAISQGAFLSAPLLVAYMIVKPRLNQALIDHKFVRVRMEMQIVEPPTIGDPIRNNMLDRHGASRSGQLG